MVFAGMEESGFAVAAVAMEQAMRRPVHGKSLSPGGTGRRSARSGINYQSMVGVLGRLNPGQGGFIGLILFHPEKEDGEKDDQDGGENAHGSQGRLSRGQR